MTFFLVQKGDATVHLIVIKMPHGWHCGPCNLHIDGRQDAFTHMVDRHRIPAEFVVEDETGDFYDGREAISLEKLQEAGL